MTAPRMTIEDFDRLKEGDIVNFDIKPKPGVKHPEMVGRALLKTKTDEYMDFIIFTATGGIGETRLMKPKAQPWPNS